MFAKRKIAMVALLLALFMLLSPIQALLATDPDGELTVTKGFDPTGSLFAGGGELRGEKPKYKFKVTGPDGSTPDGYTEEFELSPGEQKVLKKLFYGVYTVTEELAEGMPRPFFHETDGDTNGANDDGVVRLSSRSKTAKVEVVNRPALDDSLELLLVKKIWLGGKPANADDLSFEAYANGVFNKEFIKLAAVDLENLGIVPADNEVYYAVEVLKYDENGVPISHTVKEKDMPAGYRSVVPPHPTVTTHAGERFLQWDVTNIPVKNIILNKYWNDLDGINRAGVKFTLYRSVEGEAPEVVGGAPVFTPSTDKNINDESFVWEDVPLYSDEGKLYTYFVKEEFTNPADPNNNNWQITEKHDVVFSGNGSYIRVYNDAVQNDEEIIATKTWEDATNPKPEIKFELWRKGGTAGEGEKVVDATELTDDKVNFGKQPKKDGNGVAYTYFVKEVFTNPEERANWTITGEGEGLTVNNKLKTGEETGGRLRIVKKTSPEGAGGDKEFEITITGPYGFTQVIKLKAGQETMLHNLHFGEYKVEETEIHGFTPSYDPESGKVTLTSPPKTVTVTVTNKKDPVDPPVTNYDPIYIEIAAEKKLLNGKLKAGDFTFELYKGDKLVETVTNDAAGNVTFKARKFVSPATIKYTVKEVVGSDTKRISYDGTIYTVTVKVTDEGGRLVPSISYERDGMPYGGKLQFVNRVKPPKTGDSYTGLPLVFAMVSMLSLAGTSLLKKKKHQNK